MTGDPAAQWLEGGALDPAVEDAVRRDLVLAREVAVEALELLAAISREAEREVERADDAWSDDAWTRGFVAGRVAAMQRTQQASAHAANYLRWRLR